MQIYKWSLFTMYVLCIIVLSLLILKMVKEAVVNTYMEGRLDSIEKEMIQLKRTNRILKRSNRKFERIVIGALVRKRRNVIRDAISDLRGERKGYNTSYVKRIETMAEKQMSKNIKKFKKEDNQKTCARFGTCTIE